MTRKEQNGHRREKSLSRERIVDASIEILDSEGEGGLTFPALSRKLETGPGAIYWHIADKNDLLTAACDAIVARAVDRPKENSAPETVIRELALAMFDMIDEHQWVGSALTRAPGKSPALRILESVGQQVQALGVPDAALWSAVSALLSYILGVAGQNAANARFAQANNLNRADFLDTVATGWLELDPDIYPFARSVAAQLRVHDDRADFLAGIDYILRGLERFPS